jgi:hypothetical protein
MNALVKRRFSDAGVGPIVIALLALACLGPSAWAAPVTFAQFTQQTPSAQPFAYTNNSSSATFDAATFNINLIVSSSLSSFMPPGIYAATLQLTSSTSSPATQSGSALMESFPTPTNNSITITLNNPVNGSTNFLTVSYSAHLGGNVGASAIGLTAAQSSGDTINYSSGVVPILGSTTSRGFSLSFSSVTPTLGLGAGNFYNSFVASGTGTFQAQLPAVPEPGSLILAGTLLSGLAGCRLWRRKAS